MKSLAVASTICLAQRQANTFRAKYAKDNHLKAIIFIEAISSPSTVHFNMQRQAVSTITTVLFKFTS